MTDQELVAGILNQDETAARTFVEMHQDFVYRQAITVLKNSQDAEEVCQDVFLKAFRKMDTFEGKSQLTTWLYQITYFTCLDLIKKQKRRPSETDLDHAPEPAWEGIDDALSQLELQDQRAMIDAAMANLSEVEAMLINMYYFQELSTKEIAEVVEMSVSNVKVRMLRARHKLARHLKEDLPVGLSH